MHILVLNVGSSTLKFQLIATDEASIVEARDQRLARCISATARLAASIRLFAYPSATSGANVGRAGLRSAD